MKRREQVVGIAMGDPYRLVRLLGSGATGTVYDAHRIDINKRCVVKVMNGAIGDSAEELARFQSDAEIASRLAHQNLVRVLDFGTAPGGQPYLVMEHLEGESLAHRLRSEGRLDAPLAGHICRQAAAALAAAHDRGVVHAAIKPTNLLLVPREGDPDLVKVLDCGTAQVDSARSLTHAGMLQDTLPYVAPEQAAPGPEGRVIDHRTDQWALACVAWHMLTGRPPFSGEDATALLYQIAYEEPAQVTDETPVIPAPAMTVLRQALQKRPDSRFPDITAFARALVEAVGPLPVAQQKSKSAPRATLLGLPTAPVPSEPVFLPGVSRRESPKRPRTSRGTAAVPTRVQGLRVRTSAGADPASEGSAELAAFEPTRETVALAPSGDGGLAGLRNRLAAVPGRRWMLVAALPAALTVVLMIGWSVGERRPPVDVERTRSAAPEASSGPRRASTRATIVPLTARSQRATVVESRRRARVSRAKRAGLSAKARRADNRPRERRPARRR